MKCPFCYHDDTQVLETRVQEDVDAIRRRRRCGKCDKRFTTFERVELSMPIVVKKNGMRTEYASGKLRGSLMLALRKRPDKVAYIRFASVYKNFEDLNEFQEAIAEVGADGKPRK